MLSLKNAAPIAMTILALGCHKNTPVEVRELRWLETADPLVDARAALSRGDHRLCAVQGLTITIPGTDEGAFEILKRDYGINEIEGTTDALANEEHRRLAEMAYRYAEAYNRYVLGEYRPIAHS